MTGTVSDVEDQKMLDIYLSAKKSSDISIRNIQLLEQNNILLKEILEMLRKLVINTS